MKIAIISDIHDNLSNLRKTIGWLKKEKIRTLILCGDIASVETLKEILENYSGKIYLSLGNMDNDYSLNRESFKNFSQIKIKKEIGEFEIDNKKIAFTHSPILAKKLAQEEKYHIVFYGHTHKPWEEKIGKTKLVNPGNLAGLLFKATFARYDTETDKLELMILEKIK